MKNKFEDTFIDNYKNLIISQNSRKKIMSFNKSLSLNKFILVYPFINKFSKITNKSVIVGFSNVKKIFKFGEEEAQKAYEHVEKDNVILNIEGNTEIFETIVFETSQIEPIPLEKLSWDLLLKAEKIEDGSFSILKESFIEFFNIRSDINFDSFFFNPENKPEDIQLNVVWYDVDRGEKYGNIVTLVIWKNETIGWITTTGRWLETEVASTIDANKWIEMMQFIYEKYNFKPEKDVFGVNIVNINVDLVDEVSYVPGFSDYEYKDQEI